LGGSAGAFNTRDIEIGRQRRDQRKIASIPEQELRALREHRERYRLLFEGATDGIWVADQLAGSST
jgi:PAS domain-containing protein